MGYQELETDSIGNVMTVPTFLTVSASNECSLADFKVTGYTAPTYDSKSKKYKGGCVGGEFVMSKLSGSGLAIPGCVYYWIDDGLVGPGWFSDDVGAAIEGGAAAVKIESGRALWTSGSGYKLVPAGAVNPFDIVYTTDSVGNVAVGNPTPVEISLNDLTVTGYSAPTYDSKSKKYKGGCVGGEFVMSKLNGSGLAIPGSVYYWIDDGTVGPGWFADDVGTAIDGGASGVKIPAGLGLWTSGSGYMVTFPAPEF